MATSSVCTLLASMAILLVQCSSAQDNVTSETEPRVDDVTNQPITEFLDDYVTLQDLIYRNYPKFKSSNGVFPPPQGGSDVIIEEMFGDNVTTISTRVHVSVQTQRVVKMDIEQQSVLIKVKETYGWLDESAAWWNKDYNLTSAIWALNLDKNRIWTPPIFAKNVLKEEIISDIKQVLCFEHGYCKVNKQVQYTVPCNINVREFPFDIHDCTLVLSQPHNWHTKIDFNAMIPKQYIGKYYTEDDVFRAEDQHQEWSLEDWDNQVTPMDDYSHLNEFNYTIVLRRQAKFYFTVLILPCVLLNLLSLTIFTLPVTNTGRMDFCLALILTYFVLIMIVVDSSPPSGDQVPDLGLYIIISTGITAFTFAMSMALVEMHEHCREKKTKMPKWLSGILERFFCLSKRYAEYRARKDMNGQEDGEKIQLKDQDERKGLINDLTSDQDSQEQAEAFKWKLLGKVLNILFLILTAIAHIIIPVLIFVNESHE